MNLLDFVIIVAVFLQALAWAKNGLIMGIFSLGGFWLGMVIGSYFGPDFAKLLTKDSQQQFIYTLVSIFALALILQTVGQYIGKRSRGFTTTLHLEKTDKILGAAFSGAMTLVILWLVSAMAVSLPLTEVRKYVRESVILQTMNKVMPPAPDIVSELGNLLGPNGFPEVFSGLAPRPAEPVKAPSNQEVVDAFEASRRSIVMVEGMGCGGAIIGSGFLAAKDLIITNAHVVAGIANPSVEGEAGRVNVTTPVYFNPELDIAILQAKGYDAKPLQLAGQLYPRGATGAVIGHPGGGPLEADPAGILRQMTARGRDIYGTDVAERPVYEIQGKVVEGNSGGPLVARDGSVMGVIFARSTFESGIGYAVTSKEVLPLLEKVRANPTPVSTQQCATQKQGYVPATPGVPRRS
ncbi:MarP family serine protease [Candidatus Saccharibacteria bacterium]|nr:MarP family serine protease [Candidatus Saccharibacteria bacterium]